LEKGIKLPNTLLLPQASPPGMSGKCFHKKTKISLDKKGEYMYVYSLQFHKEALEYPKLL